MSEQKPKTPGLLDTLLADLDGETHEKNVRVHVDEIVGAVREVVKQDEQRRALIESMEARRDADEAAQRASEERARKQAAGAVITALLGSGGDPSTPACAVSP